MTELEQVRYEAFFSELGRFEQKAMLEKVAVRGILQFGRSLAKGVQRLGKVAPTGEKGITGILRRGYQRGVRGVEKNYGALTNQLKLQGVDVSKHPLGQAARVVGGVRGVLKTPTGKALGVGALGAGALGAGALGAGYAAGKAQQPSPPRY
jgi:hypothetical protein